ncbi:MAG: hypothetical protein M1832_001150 [Thelocarpon impressellum]|nr:MAG: hypothetical protein M1832_001150 [Thelocarpon impressellum]
MGPPAIVTPALLTSLRTHPHLPRNTWYLIAGVTLSALNRSDEIETVFGHALYHARSNGGGGGNNGGGEESLAVARRMREALIKAVPIGGLPKVPFIAFFTSSMRTTINALAALRASTPPSLLDLPPTTSPTGRATELHSSPAVLARGSAFFSAVYGKVGPRVMGDMTHSGTEDLAILARLLYGHVLSNTAVLSPLETSCVIIASLIPQDVNPQLKGHLRGALNHGASLAQLRAVRDVVIRLCAAAGMTRLPDGAAGGWGWRGEVASL